MPLRSTLSSGFGVGGGRGEEGTRRSSHLVCRPGDVMHMKSGISKNLAALLAFLLLMEPKCETCPPARNYMRHVCARSSSSSSHFCQLSNNHQDDLVNCHGVRLRGGGQEREGIGWDPGPAPSSSWNLLHPQWHMQDGVVDQACSEIQVEIPPGHRPFLPFCSRHITRTQIKWWKGWNASTNRVSQGVVSDKVF